MYVLKAVTEKFCLQFTKQCAVC